MTTATDQINRLFIESVIADDVASYPDGVSFIARDTPDWQVIVWRNLVEEHRTTVIVDEDALETMLVPVDRPVPLAWLDRVRGRVAVRIGWRRHGGAHAYEVPVSLTRSRLAALEPSTRRLPKQRLDSVDRMMRAFDRPLPTVDATVSGRSSASGEARSMTCER